MYYIYFLKSEANSNWVYTGYTNNISRRIKEHKEGLTKSTKPHLPIKLVAYIVVAQKYKAKQIEMYFKKGSGKAILKKRILSDGALA